MANEWIEALKVWNGKRNVGMWCVPKKGSQEYDEVIAIMTMGNMEKHEQLK